MARFFYRDGERDPEALLRVGAWCRELLALGPAATVSVAELACGEPECGGAETVVMVMAPGRKTEAVRLKMRLSAVTREGLAAALADHPLTAGSAPPPSR